MAEKVFSKEKKKFDSDEIKKVIDEWFLRNFHNRAGISDTHVFKEISEAKADLVKQFE